MLALAILGNEVDGFIVNSKLAVPKQVALFSSTKDDIGTKNATSASSKPSPSKKYKKVEIEEYEGYSRCLSPREERKDVESEFEKRSRWRRVARKIFPPRKTKKGALILLRCGQSTYNNEHTFTGWMDPSLTENGIKQCQHAGRLLVAEGFDPDIVYTSRLQRSIVSAWTVLETMDALFIQVKKTFRLNQRMYGALQGLSKRETTNEFGPEVVQAWRNSLKARPPPLSRDDPSHPCHDRRYADLPQDKIPDTESLLECQERARQLWDHQIRKDIDNGKTVLVVGHRDSLRGLSKVIDGISDKDICDINFPTGVPIVYKFNADMEPIEPDDSSVTQVNTKGVFLEKPGRLKEALERNALWNQPVQVDGTVKKRSTSLEHSLLKLRQVEEDLGPEIQKAAGMADDDDEDAVTLREVSKPVEAVERWSDDPCEFEEYDEFADFDDDNDVAVPVVALDESSSASPPQQDGPVVVLIRHGQTPHNLMQLFTGWEDPPLAEVGVEDARRAGRLLKRHGFQFDVVYTSWLTRAIQTAYYALDELGDVWLPMMKSWRLNERMVGRPLCCFLFRASVPNKNHSVFSMATSQGRARR